jgi:hypothetical protein
MIMTNWEQYGIEERISQILSDVEDEGHHFGRPYLTAYQLAIEFVRLFPDVVLHLGLKVGGAGTGERTSLAQYLARELSGKIKADPEYPVEGAFLSNRYVRNLIYDNNGEGVESSLTGANYALSMFRLRE